MDIGVSGIELLSSATYPGGPFSDRSAGPVEFVPGLGVGDWVEAELYITNSQC